MAPSPTPIIIARSFMGWKGAARACLVAPIPTILNDATMRMTRVSKDFFLMTSVSA